MTFEYLTGVMKRRQQIRSKWSSCVPDVHKHTLYPERTVEVEMNILGLAEVYLDRRPLMHCKWKKTILEYH
jgi:hypothetical protein